MSRILYSSITATTVPLSRNTLIMVLSRIAARAVVRQKIMVSSPTLRAVPSAASPIVARQQQRMLSRTMSSSAGPTIAEQQRHLHRRLLLGGGGLAIAYLAYDRLVNWYAYILLRSAATEQLFMQGLEGAVELELRLTPFSTAGEIIGRLTPVSDKPHIAGLNHRAFTIFSTANTVSTRTQGRHSAALERQLPPTVQTRHVSVFAPAHLSALILPLGQTKLYCRKTIERTECFTQKPSAWGLDCDEV